MSCNQDELPCEVRGNLQNYRPGGLGSSAMSVQPRVGRIMAGIFAEAQVPSRYDEIMGCAKFQVGASVVRASSRGEINCAGNQPPPPKKKTKIASVDV